MAGLHEYVRDYERDLRKRMDDMAIKNVKDVQPGERIIEAGIRVQVEQVRIEGMRVLLDVYYLDQETGKIDYDDGLETWRYMAGDEVETVM